MKSRVLRPGDVIPDDPGVQATCRISQELLDIVNAMIADLKPSLGEGQARSSAFSGLLSAAANLAVNAGQAEAAAIHMLRAAKEIRPLPEAADEVFRLAQSFVDLMNVAGERHNIETVVIAMLNAVGNAGTCTGNTSWVAGHMRNFADMLTDPARLADAEARAAMVTRPAHPTLQ